MAAERDYLLQNVFPVVRHACEERMVGFTEIDLRWGITDGEAEKDKTVEICLAEIDRCLEYPPFFIGFLGERYGWVPTPEDLTEYWSEAINKKYREAIAEALENNISVTELEFNFGLEASVNSEQKIEPLFYLRSPDLTAALYKQFSESTPDAKTDTNRTIFYDSHAGKLEALKTELRKQKAVTLDNYSSIQEFGESVKDRLISTLNERYPLEELPSEINIRQHQHETYAYSKRKFYLPNEIQRSKILFHVERRLEGTDARSILLRGESGIGKSALVADLANFMRSDDRYSDAQIIDRYIGADSDISLFTWINDVICICEEREVSEECGIDIWDSLDRALTDKVTNSHKPIILLIDALNQLNPSDPLLRQLLNRKWPSMVVLIASATSGFEVPERLWVCHEVANLNANQIKQLIYRFAKQFRKGDLQSLGDEILSSELSYSPLFIKLMLEYLRVFSSFESLEDDAKNLISLNNPQELFLKFIEKSDLIYKNSETPELVSRTLKFINCSRAGLSEFEIKEILGRFYNSERGKIPDFKLIPAISYVRPFLLRRDGKEVIGHSIFSGAIFLKNNAAEHRKIIADYFCRESERDIIERIYQFIMLDDTENLEKEFSPEKLMFIYTEPNGKIILSQAFRTVCDYNADKVITEIWKNKNSGWPTSHQVLDLSDIMRNAGAVNLSIAWLEQLLLTVFTQQDSARAAILEKLSLSQRENGLNKEATETQSEVLEIDKLQYEQVPESISFKDTTVIGLLKQIVNLMHERNFEEAHKLRGKIDAIIDSPLALFDGGMDYLQVVGELEALSGDPEKGLEMCEAAFKRCLETNSDRKLVEVATRLSNAYAASGNLKKAIEVSTSGLETAERLKIDSEIARAHDNLSYFYEKICDFETSIRHIKYAEKFYVNSTPLRFNTLLRLARLYNETQNSCALDVYRDILNEAYQSLPDHLEAFSESLDGYVLALIKLGEVDQAIEKAKLGASTIKDLNIGDRFFVIKSFLTLGHAFAAKGDEPSLISAENCYKIVIKGGLNEASRCHRLVFSGLCSFREVSLKLNQEDKDSFYFEKLLGLINATPSDSPERRVYEKQYTSDLLSAALSNSGY